MFISQQQEQRWHDELDVDGDFWRGLTEGQDLVLAANSQQQGSDDSFLAQTQNPAAKASKLEENPNVLSSKDPNVAPQSKEK